MREIIAPQAAQIDEQARYPRAALDALAAAGLLGLISASEVGGRGKGLAEAVQVIERIAQDCPCTWGRPSMSVSGPSAACRLWLFGPRWLRLSRSEERR